MTGRSACILRALAMFGAGLLIACADERPQESDAALDKRTVGAVVEALRMRSIDPLRVMVDFRVDHSRYLELVQSRCFDFSGAYTITKRWEDDNGLFSREVRFANGKQYVLAFVDANAPHMFDVRELWWRPHGGKIELRQVTGRQPAYWSRREGLSAECKNAPRAIQAARPER